MIPIIFSAKETSFNTNGLGRLRDCTSAVVSEERNGIYELDFEYPIDGQNFDQIRCGRVIGVTHNDDGDIQPFDIVSHTKPINGIVSFHAVHISYRQTRLTVKTTKGINSLTDALLMLSTSTPENPFTYGTNKAATGYLAAADGTPRTVRELLGGIEGSILDTYGGEYEFDRFRVMLYEARGKRRDFSIRYGVNMTDYNDETDTSETYNAIIPYWTDGEKFVIGDMVTSGETVTGRTECIPLDISDRFETKPTKAQVEAMGSAILTETRPHLPAQTIKVSFARLQDIGEEGLADLYRCDLCDTIGVEFPAYGMSGTYKIVKTAWNVLENRYEEMELGVLSTTLSEALGISNSLGTSGGGISGASFATTTEQLFASSSIDSYGHKYGTKDITKSGYYPLAIAGWASPDTRYFIPDRLRLSAQGDGTGTISFDIYNAHSSSHTGAVSADVLWLKTD